MQIERIWVRTGTGVPVLLLTVYSNQHLKVLLQNEVVFLELEKESPGKRGERINNKKKKNDNDKILSKHGGQPSEDTIFVPNHDRREFTDSCNLNKPFSNKL